MKKRIIGFVLVFVLLSMAIPVSAQTFSYSDIGISFDLPAGWSENAVPGTQLGFRYSDGGDEFIGVTMVETPGITDIADYQLEQLEYVTENTLSDASLAQILTDGNGTAVSVTTDEVRKQYAHWGTTNFYCYEKYYYANSIYGKEKRYHSLYLTAAYGKTYLLEYAHNNKNPHPSGFESLIKSIKFNDTTIKIYINNKQIFPDSNPVLVNDRTLVPIRAVAEAMGYTVNWYEAQQMVELVSPKTGNVLIFGIDKWNYARGNVNAAAEDYTYDTLDVPAQIIGSRTYLPLRAVAEGMDAVVRWDGVTNSVHIIY